MWKIKIVCFMEMAVWYYIDCEFSCKLFYWKSFVEKGFLIVVLQTTTRNCCKMRAARAARFFLSINQIPKKTISAREISQKIFVHSNEHKKRSVLFRYLTAVFMNRDCREKKSQHIDLQLIFSFDLAPFSDHLTTAPALVLFYTSVLRKVVFSIHLPPPK